MKAKGIAWTVLSAVLFGVTPVLASLSYELGSNALTLTFYRNVMVIPILLVVTRLRRTSLKITGREAWRILLVSVMGGSTTLMLYASYDYVGISTATTLHFLYPVFVALICRIFYGDRLGKPKVIALICASIGILMFLEPGEQMGLMGIVLASVSGLTYAVYMTGMDKLGLKEMDPFKMSFYMAIAVAVIMALYNIPAGQIVFALPPKAFFYTFVIALCTSFLAVALLQMGIRYLSASSAAIFCLFEPVSSSLCGVLFLKESISAAKVIGSLVILAAAAILALAGSRSGEPALEQAGRS